MRLRSAFSKVWLQSSTDFEIVLHLIEQRAPHVIAVALTPGHLELKGGLEAGLRREIDPQHRRGHDDKVCDPELGIAAVPNLENTHNRKATPGHTFSVQKSRCLPVRARLCRLHDRKWQSRGERGESAP